MAHWEIQAPGAAGERESISCVLEKGQEAPGHLPVAANPPKELFSLLWVLLHLPSPFNSTAVQFIPQRNYPRCFQLDFCRKHSLLPQPWAEEPTGSQGMGTAGEQLPLGNGLAERDDVRVVNGAV